MISVMEKSVDRELLPEARALLDHWRDLAGKRRLPAFTEQVQCSLDRWLPDVSIVDLHEGSKRFFIRYHGSGTQLHIGDNLTGLYFEDVLIPIVRVLALAPYEEAIRSKRPTRSTMIPRLYRSVFSQLDRVVLPFGEMDTVTSFITWVGPTDKCAASVESVYDRISALADPKSGVKDIVSLAVL